MSSERRREQLEHEYDLPPVPQRQNQASRKGSTRLRTNTRSRVKTTKSARNKKSKVGGIHQRSNKRMSW